MIGSNALDFGLEPIQARQVLLPRPAEIRVTEAVREPFRLAHDGAKLVPCLLGLSRGVQRFEDEGRATADLPVDLLLGGNGTVSGRFARPRRNAREAHPVLVSLQYELNGLAKPPATLHRVQLVEYPAPQFSDPSLVFGR